MKKLSAREGSFLLSPGILFIDYDGDLSLTLGFDSITDRLCSYIWFDGHFVSTYKELPHYAYTWMQSLLT